MSCGELSSSFLVYITCFRSFFSKILTHPVCILIFQLFSAIMLLLLYTFVFLCTFSNIFSRANSCALLTLYFYIILFYFLHVLLKYVLFYTFFAFVLFY